MPRVFDLIRPLDNRDTYAITDVVFQKGGLREVENIEAMHAISMDRRRSGMIAFIIESGEFYSLSGGDLTNDSWEKIDFSKNIIGPVTTKEINIEESSTSFLYSEDENVSPIVTDTSIIRITNAVSIGSITDINVQDGKLLFLQNLSEDTIIIKDDFLKVQKNFSVFVEEIQTFTDIVYSNNRYIMTSSDGFLIETEDFETSTVIPDIDENSWQSIANYEDIFVAVANDGDNRIVFSIDDGATWTHVSVNQLSWNSIANNGNLFVAVAEGMAMYSLDYLEWTYVTLPEKNWKQIIHDGNKFIAIAETLDGLEDIIYSEDDSVTWTIVDKGNTELLQKIYYLNNKFYLITDQSIMSSNDGIEWETLNFPFDDDEVQEIIYNNNYYFFIKKDIVYYTHNFIIWKEFEFINTENFKKNLIIDSVDSIYYLFTENSIKKLTLDVIENIYPIYTGTNLELLFLKNSSILLQFSAFENIWRVIGGIALNPTFLSLLDVPNSYPSVPVNNNIFVSVNPESSDDKVIFNNPFPVIENEENNLVIDRINGLRIRRFDSDTGELVFAKFTPTLTSAVPSLLINFDDQITQMTVLVTNDTFIPNTKLNNVYELKYYINTQFNDQFSLLTEPVLPYVDNSYEWSETFVFDTIQDSNENFVDEPNSFTLISFLSDTIESTYETSKTIAYRSPNFSFSVNSATEDFRNTISETILNFVYTNITSRQNYSEITSITSDLPSNPQFINFTNGMLTYTAQNLNITNENLTKSNLLTDTQNFTFTTICRYTRPIEIDPNENFNDIEITENFTVNFNYPVFVGTTSINVESLTATQVINDLTNAGSNPFPRIFSQNITSNNLHWWFAVRKRYINGVVPNVTLSSNGFTISTVIIYENDVEITTPTGSETYTCYCIVLQANNNYVINISFL